MFFFLKIRSTLHALHWRTLSWLLSYPVCALICGTCELSLCIQNNYTQVVDFVRRQCKSPLWFSFLWQMQKSVYVAYAICIFFFNHYFYTWELLSAKKTNDIMKCQSKSTTLECIQCHSPKASPTFFPLHYRSHNLRSWL